MTKALRAVFGLLPLIFATSALAQSETDPAAERLKNGIVFRGTFTTPNELDSALMPYLECVMARAKTKRVDNVGVQVDIPHNIPADCLDLRAKAQIDADQRLLSMKIKSAEDRKIIVSNALLAIDLVSQGNAVWMERAR